MQVTVPLITNLLASNVSEASFSDWLAATTYGAGVRVYILYSDFPELLSYGDCTFDQFEVDGPEWSYDGTNSEYDCDGAQAGNTKIYQNSNVIDTDDLYLVVYEVKNYVAGEVKAYVQGGLGTARSADGTYLEVVTAGSTDTKSGVQGNATFDGSITNLSIKKIGAYYSRDVYESQEAANANNYPPDDDGTNWAKVSASNRWKMFDDFMASQAENTVKISTKVKANKTNSLAFFLAEATNIEYIVSDDSTTETSVTNETPAAGDISMVVSTNNTWAVGQKVEVYVTADQRAFFAGTIKTWDQGTGAITITSAVYDDPAGSAPYAAWTMALVYDHESTSLYQEEVLSWTDYFFSPIRFSSSKAFSYTYSYNTSCRVIFTGSATSMIRVGHLVVGHSLYLGQTRYGLKGGITDFSTKDANSFGEYQLVERAWAKELRYTLNVLTDGLDQVFQILTQLRATPCVYDGNNDSTSMSLPVAFGFFSDFEVMIQSNKTSECELEVQGLT